MTLQLNSDIPAILFSDCGYDLSSDGKMLWAAMADCASCRHNRFSYFSFDALREKLGGRNLITNVNKPWGDDRLRNAIYELEFYSIISHHGSWRDRIGFKSNVYWVAPFAVLNVKSPEWQPIINLYPHGDVKLTKPRKHKPVKKRNRRSANNVPILGNPSTHGKHEFQDKAQLDTTPVVGNPNTNCLIKGRINKENYERADQPIFLVPDNAFNEQESSWQRVQRFLALNGKEDSLIIHDMWRYLEKLGLLSIDQLDHWPSHIWSLISEKKVA